MAEAVEKANVVIACITQGYQESRNCRSELSYANVLGKKIVPVKVDPQFKPSGWLGFITGAKLFYVVKRPEDVSEQLPEIVDKELKGVDKSRDRHSAAISGTPSPPDASSRSTDADQDWFTKNGTNPPAVTRNIACPTF